MAASSRRSEKKKGPGSQCETERTRICSCRKRDERKLQEKIAPTGLLIMVEAVLLVVVAVEIFQSEPPVLRKSEGASLL